ncbi:NAD(P)H-hydrate dehydratase [Sphingobacterium corticis]|uniref:Bifunctional NAD(P)H-hydrate repair enzyme n=1 Tax=Sphingobacterium corticis TaxID=1812823 RepID=A0ABW5NI98_9SPHI
MKILSASDVHTVDRATIERQGIRSIDLMERAAQRLFEQTQLDFPNEKTTFVIFCGNGNNGGDGLALGRLLYQAGRSVRILLQNSEEYSADNLENQQRLHNMAVKVEAISNEILFSDVDIIVDCLFGIGLSRPLNQDWHVLISAINATKNTVIAVDIPSGLYADQTSDFTAPIIQADWTYTFHCPKLALLQPENGKYVGSFQVLDIGLSESALQEIESRHQFITKKSVQQLVSMPSRFAHKGTFGHALISGGSYGKIGAVHLSAKAALKSGCGMITIHSPACAYPILQTNFPEAMLTTDETFEHLSAFPTAINPYKAIGFGMGMSQHEKTKSALFEFLRNLSHSSTHANLVLDADALNILSQHPEYLFLLPKEAILTPHPKELERIIGSWQNDWEKLAKARAFAQKHQVIVLIKGANTAVVLPDGEIHFNSTGNWGMATAGSGDVLAGIITSLLAQSFLPKNAAILGVYLHGLAADCASRHIHPKSIIASDIISGISDAWEDILPV